MQLKVKQIIALVVVVALLMAGSVLVTMAYLTDTKSVTNVFTVGNIRMTLDEAKVNLEGVPQKDDEGNVIRESVQNEYHLLPGHSYTKDPTITILADSDECYVRMMVTVSDYSKLTAAFPAATNPEYYMGEMFLLEKLIGGWDRNIWEMTSYDAETATYEFRYHKTVLKSDADQKLEALFETVEIPADINNDALSKLADLRINVVAHAIQEDGFADANEAWAAFEGGEEPTTPTESTDEEPTATTDGN